ncbi:extracellular solute-binding protein [Rossellomorea marisflavi]|uniref:extracellular solute-binding protein n=1 Tax=Rossellomorea marisflavi TaxID=189381 RepID=UPI0035113A29
MKLTRLVWPVALVLLFVLNTQVYAEGNNGPDKSAEEVVEEKYHSVLNDWNKEEMDSKPFEAAVPSSEFTNVKKDQLRTASESKEYGDRVLYWANQEAASFEVEVPEDGLYELAFDYYPLGDGVIPIEGAIKVNGEFPFYESRRIVFPMNWENQKKKFEKDRFGNEMVPKQKAINEWMTAKAEDASHLQAEPLKYHLEKGKNTISLENVRGEMLIGKAVIATPEKLHAYKEYVKKTEGDLVKDQLLEYEAEHPWKKNSSYIRPVATQDSSVSPYDAKLLVLNTYGGESWQTSGQRTDWKVKVKEDGYYRLTFKALQNKSTGAPVFRTLSIDGSIPFKEAAHFSIPFSKDWKNVTLQDEEGDPYMFYLTKGEHVIGLEADGSPVERVLYKMNEVSKEIEELSLSIKKLTGNQQDQSRGWKISEYIPDIEDRLVGWSDSLEKEAEYMRTLSDREKDSSEIVSLMLAVDKLRNLAKSPNEVPSRLNELSEGSNSVAQLMGNLTLDIQKQPLLLDSFYIYGDEELPKAENAWYKKFYAGMKRFALSFTSDTFTTSEAKDDKTIEVWVNRPRQYVELIQNMADQSFTPETGIKVKFSLMPDEQKLILANAADKQPDVALGISNWLPYELAMRGAAADLKQFDGFNAYSKQFSPGAFLPMMVEDGVYALPETQDFFVLYSRKDILNALDVPVPDTWDDTLEILPELQRYGMNFYTPMAGAVGFKPFQTTAPFIYQFQGDLYEEDGMKTAIDSENSLEAIQFMTDLNTVYSMPLQVPNFYNHFRYGTLPIGISNFETYVQLTSAAPEIAGWWDISPYPGVKQEDGTVDRWATGSGQSAMIFDRSKQKDEAWELLQWWLSTDTQTEFASSLQTLYGPEYMWNTANIEAFKTLPWPEEHKQAILKQWEYLREVPKTPGAYMVERELSNAWNRIVFDGENTRSAVDDSVIAIDREMERKMEEFGYMKDGKVVKPYPIPSIDEVKKWSGE